MTDLEEVVNSVLPQFLFQEIDSKMMTEIIDILSERLKSHRPIIILTHLENCISGSVNITDPDKNNLRNVMFVIEPTNAVFNYTDELKIGE